MTEMETLRNGEEKLYDEPTLRDSPVFNLIEALGVGALRLIGRGIDRVTKWIPLPSYPTGEGDEKPNANVYSSQIPLGSDGAFALDGHYMARKRVMEQYACKMKKYNDTAFEIVQKRISKKYMEVSE